MKSAGLFNFHDSYPNEANLGAINAPWVVLLWNDFGFWLQTLFGKKNPRTQVFDVPPISLTNKLFSRPDLFFSRQEQPKRPQKVPGFASIATVASALEMVLEL